MSVQDNVGQDSPLRLTRAQSRAVDQYAVEVLGLPGLVLMENAGINAAGAVFDVLQSNFMVDEDSARVAVLCGGGNNGGDGYVAARHLAAWGVPVQLYAVKPPEALKGDAAVMAGAWTRGGGRVESLSSPEEVAEAAREWMACHVVVDAMLGTGFGAECGVVRGVIAAAIGALNGLLDEGSSSPDHAFRGRVVSLDVPSGLDADTGAAVGDAVRADKTVTFVAEKAGFADPAAEAFLGQVVIAEIGLPPSAVAAAQAWNAPG